jgi:hypothetical protein
MEVEKLSGGRIHLPSSHVARPADRHLASYRLSQIDGAPPWPYKYPLTSESRHTHTTF